MPILKLCGFAILCVLLMQLLRQQRGEYAMLVGLAGGVALLGYVLSAYLPVVNYITGLIKESALAPYAETLLKAMGVGLAVQVGADICRDTGESGLAQKLELAGKAEILVLCLPLIAEMVDLAKGVIRQ